MFQVLHSFVNLFAGGRSDSKTILFLLYLLVLVVLVNLFKKDTFSRLSVRWGIVNVGFLYLYGLISHVMLFKYYNLPLNSFAITGNNKEISSTSLFSIHEVKGVIGFILSKFGIGQLQTIDAGGVYTNLLSSWWFIVGAILIAISILFVIFYIYKFSQYYSTGNRWKNILFIIWYAVISFSLVKTAIDGGVLTPSLLALLVSIYLFNYMRWQKDNRVPLLAIFITSIVGFIAVLIFPNWSGGIVLMQLLGTLLLLTTLTLGIFGAPKNIYIIISIVLLLVSWWLGSVRDREIFKYGSVTINKGESYFSYNTKGHMLEESISPSGTTISRVVKLQQKNLSYAPISVPGKTCSQNGIPQFIDVLIKTKVPMQAVKTPYLNIFVKDQIYNEPWWNNEVTIILQSCLPEILTVIDDILKEQGINFYVMVDPLFYDEHITH